MNKEEYYDNHIAPKLMELARECEDNGLSILAVCEWEPGEYGSTRSSREGTSFALRMADAALQANGNLDLFMIAMERYALEHGHNSLYLEMRNIPARV